MKKICLFFFPPGFSTCHTTPRTWRFSATLPETAPTTPSGATCSSPRRRWDDRCVLPLIFACVSVNKAHFFPLTTSSPPGLRPYDPPPADPRHAHRADHRPGLRGLPQAQPAARWAGRRRAGGRRERQVLGGTRQPRWAVPVRTKKSIVLGVLKWL